MTGRRLYDAWCDAHAELSLWERERNSAYPTEPLAWPFLKPADRRTWNALARKLKPAKARRVP